jgi:membrane protease YdiL (CAAX protease family)
MTMTPYEEPPIYETYNMRYIPPSPPRPSWISRVWARTPSQPYQVPVPAQMPGWLGDRRMIVNLWLVSMAVIAFDEWHNYGVLPRPARLWWTSLTYGLLMIAAIPDPLVPIANALALGYTLVLAYQYFSAEGQFAGTKPPPPAAPGHPAPTSFGGP